MSSIDRVGDYHLLERLGAGGMGTVYLAEHAETGARYAVKVLAAGDPELALRFRREGQALARVDRHRNVVCVHALGEEEKRLYLVQDLVRGGDLAVRLRKGPLPPEEVAALGRDLALGLEHVHARGVLHRDLKPANVLIDEDGTPKLVDFGLARLADADAMTETGSLLGTPAYMAPEQVEGGREGIGPWTDIYGLGALLYHCLTGAPPFQGGSVLAILNGVMREPPPAMAGVPPALEAVCRRALAKDPAQRQASAADLAAELEAFLRGELEPPPRPWVVGVAALGVAALVVVIAGSLQRPPVTKAVTASPEPKPTSTPESSASPLPLSPPRSVRSTSEPEFRGGRTWPRPVPPSSLGAHPNLKRLPVIIESARLDFPGGLRRLGQWHLRLRRFGGAGRRKHRPGRGFQLWRRAVMFGDAESAGRLALAHGAVTRLGSQLERSRARQLGLKKDPKLMRALLAIAAESDTLDAVLSDAVSAQKDSLPKLRVAYATVRDAFLPATVEAALKAGERVLDREVAKLSLERRRELRAWAKGQPQERVHDRGRELESKELPAAVYLLRRSAALWNRESEHNLALWLLQGGPSGLDPSKRMATVPLAGLWRLFQQAEAGNLKAAILLARAYAGPPAGAPWERDMQIVRAWSQLGLRHPEGPRERMKLAASLGLESLPDPPGSDVEAWLVVRAALPWATRD